MEFSPRNKIVKLCLQGMSTEENGLKKEATNLFLQAWNEASYEFEKFISAYFLSKSYTNASDKLQWLETALQIALRVNDDTVRSALPILYSSIAQCHEALGNAEQAKENYSLAGSIDEAPADSGPFYHGTKADLKVGDLLTAGTDSNYKQDLKMNHVYFTAMVNGAGLAAELAKGNKRCRVYVVEPTGEFENDPNVTNMKFPGNPTRSYRSVSPLKIVGELENWESQTPEELERWKEKLAAHKGEIIN